MVKTFNIQHSTFTLRPIFIAGPTAVGKSAVALALAEQIGGEIITADSMQVYRGLDIGTAKPTAEERTRVPHHLLDVCDLRESFDAARFVQLAEAAAKDIQSRGKTPVYCGGTGLYFKALLEGLGEAPPTDDTLRAELSATPMTVLLEELRERDPETFVKIDRQNPRRVIRAVEVIRLTGKKFSEQRAAWQNQKTPSSNEKLLCLARPSAELHERISRRVEEMFTLGLVEETRALLLHGLAENKFAMQAIGYRQVVEHLRGEHGLPETIELVKSQTRYLAKRQMTWFRRHGNCIWLELKPESTPAEVASQCLELSAGN